MGTANDRESNIYDLGCRTSNMYQGWQVRQLPITVELDTEYSSGSGNVLRLLASHGVPWVDYDQEELQREVETLGRLSPEDCRCRHLTPQLLGSDRRAGTVHINYVFM